MKKTYTLIIKDTKKGIEFATDYQSLDEILKLLKMFVKDCGNIECEIREKEN